MACKTLLDLVIKSHRQNGSEFIKPALDLIWKLFPANGLNTSPGTLAMAVPFALPL
jgi:hypothetical protein